MKNIDKLIGNTPIIKIEIRYKGNIKNIYAKLEYYNYTGSIKDRIAYYIINKSKELGLLKDNQPIIEATSGNTGIAFASFGALYNHKVIIFMPDWASKERIELMKLYGADVRLVSKEEGGFESAIKMADDLAKKIDGFRPNQFNNQLNIDAHYNLTGNEIINSLNKIDAYVSGIGTGGTLIGVGKRIKDKFKNAKIIAMEPKQMPLLSQNKVGDNHRIEGIADDFIPDLVDKNLIDEVIVIDDEEAIIASRLLASKIGLAVGISSGANFLAGVYSNYKNIVTIFADDAKKYLTTDLTKNSEKKLDIDILNIDVM